MINRGFTIIRFLILFLIVTLLYIVLWLTYPDYYHDIQGIIARLLPQAGTSVDINNLIDTPGVYSKRRICTQGLYNSAASMLRSTTGYKRPIFVSQDKEPNITTEAALSLIWAQSPEPSATSFMPARICGIFRLTSTNSFHSSYTVFHITYAKVSIQ